MTILSIVVINLCFGVVMVVAKTVKYFDGDKEVDEMMIPLNAWREANPKKRFLVKIWARATVLSLPLYYLTQAIQ